MTRKAPVDQDDPTGPANQQGKFTRQSARRSRAARRAPRVVRGKAAAVRVHVSGKQHGAHASVVSPRTRIISSACAFLLCLLTGWMGATNLHFNGRTEAPRDVTGLIAQRQERVKDLRHDISRLSSEIDSINKAVGNKKGGSGNNAGNGTAGAPVTPGTTNGTHADGINGGNTNSSGNSASSTSVLPALTGPGISVTLDDSPLWEDALHSGDKDLSDHDVNDYVVHQQDLEAVINALWAGGAEAMTIQGERVLPTTAVRCVGNVLLLRGRQYAPPYTVAAIGPINDMKRSLASSPAVRIYRQYVDAVGLGWKVDESANLHFASTSAITSLNYATVETKRQ